MENSREDSDTDSLKTGASTSPSTSERSVVSSLKHDIIEEMLRQHRDIMDQVHERHVESMTRVNVIHNDILESAHRDKECIYSELDEVRQLLQQMDNRMSTRPMPTAAPTLTRAATSRAVPALEEASSHDSTFGSSSHSPTRHFNTNHSERQQEVPLGNPGDDQQSRRHGQYLSLIHI